MFLAGCNNPVKVNDICHKIRITHLNFTLISLNKDYATFNADLSFTSDTDFMADINIMVDKKAVIKINDLSIKKGPNFQSVSFTIHDPQFWWANNFGEPHLYLIGLQIKNYHKLCFNFEKKMAVRDLLIKNDTSKALQGLQIVLNKTNITPKIAFCNFNNLNKINILAIKNYLIKIKESNFNSFVFSDTLFKNYNQINEFCDSLGLINLSSQKLKMENMVYDPIFSYSLNFRNIPDNMDTVRYNANKACEILKITKDDQSNFKSLKDSINKYFITPTDFGTLVYYSQILQSNQLKNYTEKERIKNNSFLYPVNFNKQNSKFLEGSIFDSENYIHPADKILAPILSNNTVIPVENEKNIDIYLINDNPEIFEGILLCKLLDFNGNSYYVKQIPVTVKDDNKTLILSLEKASLFKNISSRQCVLIVQVSQPGQVVSQNLLYFDIPKNLELPKAKIIADINEFAKGYNLNIKSNVLLKNLFLTSKSRKIKFSMNNIDLLPNKKIKISVYYNGKKEDFQKDLRIYTLNASEIIYK